LDELEYLTFVVVGEPVKGKGVFAHYQAGRELY
jgi:hypothetical protein